MKTTDSKPRVLPASVLAGMKQQNEELLAELRRTNLKVDALRLEMQRQLVILALMRADLEVVASGVPATLRF